MMHCLLCLLDGQSMLLFYFVHWDFIYAYTLDANCRCSEDLRLRFLHISSKHMRVCVCIDFATKTKMFPITQWTKSKYARTNDRISLEPRLGVILRNLFFCFCFFVFWSRQVESSLWIHLTSTIHASWENIVAFYFFLNFSDGWFWAHTKKKYNSRNTTYLMYLAGLIWYVQIYHFEIFEFDLLVSQSTAICLCAYVQLDVYFSATCKHQTTNTDTHLAWYSAGIWENRSKS